MDLFNILLPYLQIGVALLLITAILLQQRGSGLGAAFGGEEGSFHRSRRGAEKILFNGTIVLGSLFFVLAFISLII